MGKLINFDGNGDLKGVNPDLRAIIKAAAAASPYDVKIIDGQRVGGKANHKHGHAIDIQLIDPQTGAALPNKMYYPAKDGQPRKIIPGAPEAFKAYEQFAQTARVYQTKNFPKYDGTFRWGGGFEQGGTPFDMMHFDVTPERHGAMAYYDWNSGIKQSALARVPGIQSVGGGLGDKRRVAQIQQQLAGSGGLVPPANIPGPAPIPATRRGNALAAIDNAAPNFVRPEVIPSAYGPGGLPRASVTPPIPAPYRGITAQPKPTSVADLYAGTGLQPPRVAPIPMPYRGRNPDTQPSSVADLYSGILPKAPVAPIPADRLSRAPIPAVRQASIPPIPADRLSRTPKAPVPAMQSFDLARKRAAPGDLIALTSGTIQPTASAMVFGADPPDFTGDARKRQSEYPVPATMEDPFAVPKAPTPMPPLNRNGAQPGAIPPIPAPPYGGPFNRNALQITVNSGTGRTAAPIPMPPIQRPGAAPIPRDRMDMVNARILNGTGMTPLGPPIFSQRVAPIPAGAPYRINGHVYASGQAYQGAGGTIWRSTPNGFVKMYDPRTIGSGHNIMSGSINRMIAGLDGQPQPRPVSIAPQPYVSSSPGGGIFTVIGGGDSLTS